MCGYLAFMCHGSNAAGPHRKEDSNEEFAIEAGPILQTDISGRERQFAWPETDALHSLCSAPVDRTSRRLRLLWQKTCAKQSVLVQQRELEGSSAPR